MRKADLIGALAVIAFGLLAITQAARLEYWSDIGPGSGFIPLWSSIAFVLGGIALLIQAWRRPREDSPKVRDAGLNPRIMQIIWVSGLMVAAALAMDIVGFTVSAAAFCLTLSAWIGHYKFRASVIYSVATAVGFYLTFEWALQVPLPKGFMGF